MKRLIDFPLADSAAIRELRRSVVESSQDAGAILDLGIALAASGCSYEAAVLLRPLRRQWQSTPDADRARGALEAQAWWNKHWREFVTLKRSGEIGAAVQLLGDRAVLYWDLPALLVHLGELSATSKQLDLSHHIFQRILHLSERGLPKMDMTAFEYVARAALVDNSLQRGSAEQALRDHQAIKPSPGNAMAHEFQLAVLLVATGDFDRAMRHLSSMLVTATKQRSGYGKSNRLEFVATACELAPLRKRADWTAMCDDPAAYLSK